MLKVLKILWVIVREIIRLSILLFLLYIFYFNLTNLAKASPIGGYNFDYVRTYSWKTTKIHLKHYVLQQQHPTTLYGNCAILPNYTVSLKSCGYIFRYSKYQGSTTIANIDIEHVVPSSRLMKHAKCKGLSRVQCRANNKEFRRCHNNPHNLYPAISTINRFRGNLEFNNIPDNLAWFPFGKQIGFKKSIDGKFVEPSDVVKPTIAYSYITMHNDNCITLSKDEISRYMQWYSLKYKM